MSFRLGLELRAEWVTAEGHSVTSMHGKHLRIFVAVAVWSIATACNGCFGCQSPVDRPGSTLSKACDEKQPVIAPQELDILFVIDNSGSMKEEQEGVARELTAFVNKLRVAGGVKQEIRVGAITTTVYENFFDNGVGIYRACSGGYFCTQSGKLQPVPDVSPDGGVIPGSGSQRVIDAADDALSEKFARLVQQGTSGSGQETPFEALRLALVDLMGTPLAQGGNGGFLRDGARLLIVVLTDEDDCSEKGRPPKVSVGQNPSIDYCGDKAMQLTTVAEYFDIFNGLKNSDGSKKEVVYTTIGPVGRMNKAAMRVLDPVVGPDGGSYNQVRNIDCPTSIEPGFRHRAMTEMFDPSLQNLASICQPSYQQTLIDIAALAGIAQTIEISGVPDPGVLQIIIKRGDGAYQSPCTIDNGGFTWTAATESGPGKATLGPTCLRRLDDLELKIERLCIY